VCETLIACAAYYVVAFPSVAPVETSTI